MSTNNHQMLLKILQRPSTKKTSTLHQGTKRSIPVDQDDQKTRYKYNQYRKEPIGFKMGDYNE